MLLPKIFTETNLLDEIFDMPFGAAFSRNDLMKTDVKETADGYALDVELPGVKKENMKAELKDGQLTISATTGYDNEEKDEKGRFIRRERFSGSCSRSFYVGDAVTEEDIKAKFEDGVLKISVPKKEKLPEPETQKLIEIQ